MLITYQASPVIWDVGEFTHRCQMLRMLLWYDMLDKYAFSKHLRVWYRDTAVCKLQCLHPWSLCVFTVMSSPKQSSARSRLATACSTQPEAYRDWSVRSWYTRVSRQWRIITRGSYLLTEYAYNRGRLKYHLPVIGVGSGFIVGTQVRQE